MRKIILPKTKTTVSKRKIKRAVREAIEGDYRVTDIVERLRAGFRSLGLARAIRRKEDEPYPGEPYMSMDDALPLLNEAADEIERLRRACELADRQYAKDKDEIERLREACEGYLGELATMRANKDNEIERLRAALWEIKSSCPGGQTAAIARRRHPWP